MENNPQVTQVEEEPKKKKNKKDKPKKTVMQEIMSWVWLILAAVVIACVIRSFVFEPIKVDGRSMDRTLKDGEVVYCSKVEYLFSEPQRGDVIICRFPDRNKTLFNVGGSLSVKSHTLFVKRLVALPHDTVAILEGKLYVNDQLVEDPENMGSLPYANYKRTTLKDNEYFVIGDNRGNSHDSRAEDVGPLTRDDIVGKVDFVLLPLQNIRTIK